MGNICEIDIALLIMAIFFAGIFVWMVLQHNKLFDEYGKAVREKQSAERRLSAICKLRGLAKEDFE